MVSPRSGIAEPLPLRSTSVELLVNRYVTSPVEAILIENGAGIDLVKRTKVLPPEFEACITSDEFGIGMKPELPSQLTTLPAVFVPLNLMNPVPSAIPYVVSIKQPVRFTSD